MPLTVIQRPAGGSNGARQLARLMGVRTTRGENPLPRNTDKLIVWGCSYRPAGFRHDLKLCNDHFNIVTAANKKVCLEVLKAHQIPTVEWTRDPAVAAGWDYAIARTILQGSGGKGIVVVKKGDPLPPAPLYTKFFPSTSEWRIHAFPRFGTTLAAKKAKRDGQVEDRVVPLRNHGQLYTFKYHDVNPSQKVHKAAIDAVTACGLDFGGVDVLYDRRTGQAVVLEINTAPGLDHEVPLMWYKEQFTRWVGA